MVLISFRDYSRLKANSEKFLLSKTKPNSEINDNCKGNGAAEIEEASQLPNKEIPKQDIYQEKYANAILEDSKPIVADSTSSIATVPIVANSCESSDPNNNKKKSNADAYEKNWYYIGIPKCT